MSILEILFVAGIVISWAVCEILTMNELYNLHMRIKDLEDKHK